jgi:KEOPS complex subunit Cgi121
MARIPTRAEPLIWFEETPGAFYFGAGGDPPELKETLKRVGEVEARHGVTVHVVDGRAVCGPAHLACALMHARRARERGRPHARDPKVELMVYLAGTRQIARALKKAGIGAKCTYLGFAVEGKAQAAWDAAVELLHALDVSRADEQLRATPEKAKALGVAGSAEDEEGWEALAVEAVAMVDLE